MTAKEYNQCVKDHADGIFRFVLKNLANRADAEDVVQNTFEKLWRKHETVNYAKSKSFTYTVAYHDMIDLIRKKKFVAAYQNVPEKAAADLAKQFETKELIDKGLAELSDIQRSLVLLKDYEGYSYDEMAEITNLSLSQVKVYLFRARKKMQKIVTQLEKTTLDVKRSTLDEIQSRPTSNVKRLA